MTAPALRVIHLLGELRPSGAETMLAAAGPAFTARDVRCDILSTGATPGPYADRLAAAGYAIHHLPFAQSPSFFRRLRVALRGYDVLHLHTERAAFWIGVTARVAGVPLTVRTIHNAFAFGGGLRLRRGVQRRLLAALGVRQVAVSRSVQENERRTFGNDVELVDNWFDEGRFAPPSREERDRARAALGLNGVDAVLVSVGNCNRAKNHGELLRAVARLPPARRPIYLHAGAEEPERPERALAAALGLADRVRFLGPLADVRDALHAADAFVMPSLFEGLPISALEAIGTGLPAILTDVPGLRDLAARFPGVRVTAPHAEALAAAIDSLLSEEPASLRESVAAWPALARQAYGIEAGVGAYVQLYRGGSTK